MKDLELANISLEQVDHPNPIEKATILNSLGAVHQTIHQLQLATKYYNDSFQVLTKIDETLEKGRALKNLAGCFSIKGEHVKAFDLIEEAAKVYDNFLEPANP